MHRKVKSICTRKKEDKQGATKKIQGFVDLSNSPLQSTKEEIFFCNTPIQDTIVYGKRSITLDSDYKII